MDGENAESAVGGFDPEKRLSAMRKLCRRGPDAFTAAEGAQIAALFNSLDDWLSMGNPLPGSWDPTVSTVARVHYHSRQRRRADRMAEDAMDVIDQAVQEGKLPG